MAKNPRFAPVEHGIAAGLKKLQKYYRNLDQTDMYFICLALDPSIKDEYTKNNWDEEYHDSGMASFKDAVTSTSSSQASTSSSQTEPVASESSSQTRGYGSTWMRKVLSSRISSERDAYDPFDEVRRYFNSPLEPEGTDPIAWWGLHSAEYVVMSHMARDYLAIQGSSVASEHAFSSGGRTGTALRNRLTPETFEALQILKDGYRTGIIKSL
ncbi:hypothetical protein PHLGIDRAFT_78013 [Phlebiopsis gigantea 11061_1 CR5-6]|uniref:HAT C-terminal dimerisation domain-containing protein n=1 Tax=Phlebiopsis gigantea (strain 11061_1 CR5-6) TaxID=745531 RepID=A0A0C3NEU2_PHLG1|nr:hypothetical protein PHLGIDRAFT_78013 [Phlebiopsis gigantea 11061_1 CR5-6]